MRFCWHPDARLVDAAGQVHGPGRPATAASALPERPAARALQAALGAPAFRIGGDGPAPDGPAPDGDGVFETLTGGSSGTPRRIRRSQQSWIASFTVNAGLFGIGPDARVAAIGGLVHSLALYAAAEALHLGAELHLLAGARPDRQAAMLAARRVSHLYATPAQVQGLLAAGQDWPDLRHVIIGGARLTADLRAALARRCAARVTEFYGAAETSFIALADADGPPGSLGRAYPGVEWRLEGERLWVRSPYLAQGYAGVPGSALWQEGWVAPGEAARIEGGTLWLAGRIGRQVKIADQTVQPEEIEAFLLAQPGITAAAVIARADARRGHVLEACLHGAGDEVALLAALRAAFGPLKAPRRLHWIADWPALPSGKTDFAALSRRVACSPA